MLRGVVGFCGRGKMVRTAHQHETNMQPSSSGQQRQYYTGLVVVMKGAAPVHTGGTVQNHACLYGHMLQPPQHARGRHMHACMADRLATCQPADSDVNKKLMYTAIAGEGAVNPNTIGL